MENTERFFYIKPGDEDKLKKLSEKYNIKPKLLIDIYNHSLNGSKEITSLKIIPKFNGEFDADLSLVGIEYNNNRAHSYYTLNEFLLMK